MKKYLTLAVLSILITGVFSSCDKDSKDDTDTTETDQLTGEWTDLITDFAGQARAQASSFVIGDKLYVFGGFNRIQLKDLWVMTLSESGSSWTQKASLDSDVALSGNSSTGSLARNLAVGFAIGTKGYICTGNNGESYLKDFWEYDPATDTWRRLPDFPGSARYGAYSFVVNNKGYIGGGYGGVYLQDVYSYDPATEQWASENGIQDARMCASTFVINDKAYLVGGFGTNGYSSGLWTFDGVSETWSKDSITVNKDAANDTVKVDILRGRASAFVINGKGYLTCGVSSEGVLLNSTWEYDPSTSKWTQKASFDAPLRFGAIGATVKGRGFILTGARGSSYLDDMNEFSPE